MVTQQEELDGQRILIYDPNPVNPYGESLASVLHGLDAKVELFKAGQRSDGVHPWQSVWLFDHRPNFGSELFAHALRRFLAPLRVVAMAGRSPVVLVWVRSRWERMVFLLAAQLGIRLIQICHNPPGSRTDGKRNGQGDVPIARTLQVVHSNRLVQSCRLSPSTMVARHPLVLIGKSTEPAEPSFQHTPVFLFLGERRFDKGFDLIEEIIHEISLRIPEFEFVIAGRGPAYCPDATNPLPGVTHTDLGIDRFLSDEDVMRELGRATLLIAPYREATQSGTILLAFADGLNAVAFNVGAIPDLLRSEALAVHGNVSDLAHRACMFAESRETTYRVTPDEYKEAVTRDWSDVIAHSLEGERVGG